MNARPHHQLKLFPRPPELPWFPREEIEFAVDNAVLNEREDGVFETRIRRQGREPYEFVDEIGAAQSLGTGTAEVLQIETFPHLGTTVLLPHPLEFGEIFFGHHTAALMGTTLAGGGAMMVRSLDAHRSNASRFSV